MTSPLLRQLSSSQSRLRAELTRIFRFGVVGTAAFIVDAAVLAGAVELLEASPYWARLLSFLVASTAAWAMNRVYTFADVNSPMLLLEWVRYLVSTSAGAFCNLGVYMAAISLSGFLYDNPIIPAGFGSIAGMMVNYLAARLFVFRGAPQTEAQG